MRNDKQREDFNTFLEFFKYKNEYDKYPVIEVKDEFKAGKLLYEQFDYVILLTPKTFSVWKDDKRLMSSSTHASLLVNNVIKDITKRIYNKGLEQGAKNKVNQFKELLHL